MSLVSQHLSALTGWAVSFDSTARVVRAQHPNYMSNGITVEAPDPDSLALRIRAIRLA